MLQSAVSLALPPHGWHKSVASSFFSSGWLPGALWREPRILAARNCLRISVRLCGKVGCPHIVMSLPKSHNSALMTGRKQDAGTGSVLSARAAHGNAAGGCRPGVGAAGSGPRGPPPGLPSSLSGGAHKEVLQGLGTHVYFMNDFRERGKKSSRRLCSFYYVLPVNKKDCHI